MQYRRFGSQYVLRLEPEEELTATLCDFVRREEISGGYFMAFGAFSRVRLQFFNFETKRYEDNPVERQVEVVSLMGNVAMKDGKPKLHIHGAFGDREARTYSGHVAEGIVRPTLEVFFTPLEGELRRTHDDATGLDLLALDPPADLPYADEDPEDVPAEAIRTGAASFPYTP